MTRAHSTSCSLPRHGRLTCALLGTGIALGAACGKTSDPPVHLELGGVTPHEEGPVALSLTGQPVPDGAQGVLSLEGTWLEALGEPTRAERTFPCSVSPRGEIVVAREALGSPALPLIFEGTLRVELADAAGRAAVGAQEHAQFVLDGESHSAKERVALARRMQDARDALGVTVEPTEGGLVVRALSEDGELARAGVQPGDVLARLGAVPLIADSALVLPEGGAMPALTVRHAGEERKLALSTGARPSAFPAATAAWLVALFGACGLLLPARRGGRIADRTLGVGAAVTAALACTVGLYAPLVALLPALGLELLALREARSRAASLRGLAHTAASALALSGCVLAHGASASGARLPALFGAPGLWLALLALSRPHAPLPRVQRLARNGAVALAWGLAAASTAAALAPLLCALLALLALLFLELDPHALGARLSTGSRALLAALAVLSIALTPRLGALEAASAVLSSALLGVALGVLARSLTRGSSQGSVAEPTRDAALCEGAP